MASELRTVPIHPSINRPDQFLGAERKPILFFALVSVAPAVVFQNIVSIVFGATFWPLILWAARYAAKRDPEMRRVVMKHLKYRAYYPARSNPFTIWENQNFCMRRMHLSKK